MQNVKQSWKMCSEVDPCALKRDVIKWIWHS